MGDYNKLIVSCQVKADVAEELNEKISWLNLYDSAYQSQEQMTSVVHSKYRDGRLDLILIGQTKWGDRQREFCEWLQPFVVQGSGENDVFAMSFSEYSDTPTVWKLGGSEEAVK